MSMLKSLTVKTHEIFEDSRMSKLKHPCQTADW